MNYLEPTRYEQLINRVVPIPQKAEALAGKGLSLKRTSCFNITMPTAEFGPVKTAGERLRKLLADHCTSGCFCTCDEAVKITAAIVEAPVDLPYPEQA